MYDLLTQVVAPAVAFVLVPALFGTAQAGPVPQPTALDIKSRYTLPDAALPPLVNRKREAEARAEAAANAAAYVPVLPRDAKPEAAPNMKREAHLLISMPKREAAANPAAGSNISLQPKKRGFGGGGGCGGGGCGGGGGGCCGWGY